MTIVKDLTAEQAVKYLNEIGMAVGGWNQLTDTSATRHEKRQWRKIVAPKHSQELYVFSQHVAAWLPAGHWKLLQIDNSTTLGPAETGLLTIQLFDSMHHGEQLKGRGFLLEFDGNGESDAKKELAICNLIFSLLLVEAHAQIVSSEGHARRCLSIQDGVVYFIGDPSERADADVLVSQFESARLTSPKWVLDIAAAIQNRELAG